MILENYFDTWRERIKDKEFCLEDCVVLFSYNKIINVILENETFHDNAPTLRQKSGFVRKDSDIWTGSGRQNLSLDFQNNWRKYMDKVEWDDVSVFDFFFDRINIILNQFSDKNTNDDSENSEKFSYKKILVDNDKFEGYVINSMKNNMQISDPIELHSIMYEVILTTFENLNNSIQFHIIQDLQDS